MQRFNTLALLHQLLMCRQIEMTSRANAACAIPPQNRNGSSGRRRPKLPPFPFRTDFATFHHVSPLSAVDPPPRCVMFQPLWHTNRKRSRTMEHNHSNSRSEQRCTGTSPPRKADMGHLSNSGFSSQFNQVWGEESLRNDFSSSNNSDNNNHQGNNRMSASQGTNSWPARSFGQTDASSSSQVFGRSSNRTGSNASSMLGGVSSSGQANSVESIWGPGSF